MIRVVSVFSVFFKEGKLGLNAVDIKIDRCFLCFSSCMLVLGSLLKIACLFHDFMVFLLICQVPILCNLS